MSRVQKYKAKNSRKKEKKIIAAKKSRSRKSKNSKEDSKKHVRFTKNTKKKPNAIPKRPSVMPEPYSETDTEFTSIASEKGSPSAWENIVLYYLKKLKNLWSSEAKEAVNTDDITNVQPENKFSGSKCKYPRDIPPGANPSKINLAGSLENLIGDDVNSEKSKQIICAAIEYGIANGILERCGDYFKIISPEQEPSPAVSTVTLHKKPVNKNDEYDEAQGVPKAKCTKRPKKRVRKPFDPVVKKLSNSSVTSKESRGSRNDISDNDNTIVKEGQVEDIFYNGPKKKKSSRKFKNDSQPKRKSSVRRLKLRKFSNVLKQSSSSSFFDDAMERPKKRLKSTCSCTESAVCSDCEGDSSFSD